MKVLHLIKTTEGATWAVLQVAELVKAGVEVHVALPALEGRQLERWRAAGAILHQASLDVPVRRPWRLGEAIARTRELVASVSPDLIHSHFFGTTVMCRMALGSAHPTPRVFQIPGPLHLEHAVFRKWELATAGPQDHWIASSRFIAGLYSAAGVASDRVFLSYYGTNVRSFTPQARTGQLRARFGIPDDAFLVGNVSFLYPPKLYLGHTVGLKCHEDIIEAIALARRDAPGIRGALIGGPWGSARWYERKLRRLADRRCPGAIAMTGYLPAEEVGAAWADIDLAVHVPMSENCGGVVEPMLAGVPVIGARVGGIPEVVQEGVTGTCVPPRDPSALARAIVHASRNRPLLGDLAARGRALAAAMFDIDRTGQEVHEVYRFLLGRSGARPTPFAAAP